MRGLLKRLPVRIRSAIRSGVVQIWPEPTDGPPEFGGMNIPRRPLLCRVCGGELSRDPHAGPDLTYKLMQRGRPCCADTWMRLKWGRRWMPHE